MGNTPHQPVAPADQPKQAEDQLIPETQASARRHPGLVALALLAVCTGIALLLARSCHFGAAVLVAGVLLGLPALFVGVRAISASAPGPAPADLTLLVDQISQAVARPADAEAGRPVLLPRRPALLAGREGLLSKLHDLLAVGGEPHPRIAVLCGLGGVGKSSVAAEYAHRHLAEVGLAWQLASEDEVALEAAIGGLAPELGGARPGADPVASVHAALAAWPADWLLIFDNAPDQASVRRFLPAVGRGRVLVTSQSAVWPPGQALEVPVLGADVAAGFLVNRTGDPDSDAAVGVAAELGGLPLALEQAGAYIQATGGTLAGYLGLFRQRRASLLERGEAAGHPLTVAATIGLALSRLEPDAPAAAGLLRLLACLAPEPVPLGLLLSDADTAEALEPDVAAVIGPLLGDALATGDGRGGRTAPVLAGSPGRGRHGAGAPAGPGRRRRPDPRARRPGMAASRRHFD
jgi:hypothetical protein